MKNTTQEIFNCLFERYPELEVCKTEIARAAETLVGTFANGNKLLVCGNGGSAADSEHIVGELAKCFRKKRNLSATLIERLSSFGECGCNLANKLEQGLPAIALTGEIALSTAFINDKDPFMTFAQQVVSYGKSGDTLIAISTSGNSQNCLYAVITAKALDMNVILLTGKDGGKIKQYTDVAIVVPASETYLIQELHLPVYHTLCSMIEEELFD